MTRCSIVVRSIALLVSVTLAMPCGVVASNVLGGTDNCDTSEIDDDGAKCAAEPDRECPGNKDQCTACVDGATSKGMKCGDGGSACGGIFCVEGQKDSKDSGGSCIEIPCGG